MRQFLVNILVKLVRLNIDEDLGIVDKGRLQKFLFMAAKDDGWKNYYTLRKKSLLSLLSLGVGYNNEYWETVGRMKELKALSININAELKRRKDLEEKARELEREKELTKESD